MVRRVGEPLAAVAAPAHDPPVRGDHGADRHLLLGVGDPREGERLPHEGLVGWQEHRP